MVTMWQGIHSMYKNMDINGAVEDCTSRESRRLQNMREKGKSVRML